jgi:hypothetical protein
MLVCCNSEALCIVKVIWNTSGYSDRFAGFMMILIVNAAKTQKFATL